MALLDKFKKTNYINWNDVLIIGDSFAQQRSEPTDWPKFVTATLTQEFNTTKSPRGLGFSGASWWSSRNLLLKEVKKHSPKVLIMTHTEMQRIPSDENYGLNSASVFNIENYTKPTSTGNICPKEVLLAGQEYYKHLFCKDFHLWAQLKWFEEIDEIVKANHIPFVIHMHSFEVWDQNPTYIFKNGITFDKPLWDISDDNKLLELKSYKKINDLVNTIDADVWTNNSNRNHFTMANNVKLAQQIIDAINNYSNGLKPLQL